jgi:integrase
MRMVRRSFAGFGCTASRCYPLWTPLTSSTSRPRPVQIDIQILREEEITAGVQRIRTRSHQPLEELALYYMLFATAARPLEIARLEVRDYLDADGQVRQTSEIREAVAIMYFRSVRLDEAMAGYLADRTLRG